MKKELMKLCEELNEATAEKEKLEADYAYEKSRIYFSAEVNALANQVMRDAQLDLVLHESGWDRKIAEIRAKAKIAYYKWATFKSIIDSGRD